MKNITIKKITDLEEAQKIWNEFSPNTTYGNSWDFRFIYNRIRNFGIQFFVAYDDQKPVGLLPLEFSDEKDYLIFFGGTYFEDNELFIKDGYEDAISDLLMAVNQPFYLGWMKNNLNNYPDVELDGYRYELPIADLKSLDDYYDKYWHGKSKKKLKKAIEYLKENSEVILDDSNFKLHSMVNLNKNRFGDNSTLTHEHRQTYLNKIISEFETHNIIIKINDQIESAGLALNYKGTFVGLNSGTNPTVNNLGKFLTLLKIQQAIDLGLRSYDARGGDLNWKERFGLKAIPQYSLDSTKSEK